MRNSIARALVWVLRLLLPAHGVRRSPAMAPKSAPTPVLVGPWLKPWTSPSAAAVRRIFHAEETLPLTPMQRERHWAIMFAELGVEYPYGYQGDQFAAMEART
jgi:hypothetical protein